MNTIVRIHFAENHTTEILNCTLEIQRQGQPIYKPYQKTLSSISQLNNAYQEWIRVYLPPHLRRQRNLESDSQESNYSYDEIQEQAKKLEEKLQEWFESNSLLQLAKCLYRELKNREEEIRFIFETEIPCLQKLPWHLWEVFDDYKKAEISLSLKTVYEPVAINRDASSKGKVRILALIGHSSDINAQEDKRTIENYCRGAEVYFLEISSGDKTSNKKQIISKIQSQLNLFLKEKQGCDIFFFAGHSNQTDLSINDSIDIPITTLIPFLNKALKTGLKLAIFNSCDGLALVQNLKNLNIPQMIVMKEKVNDYVACEFLKDFLKYYAEGNSLYTSVRKAREILKEDHDLKYPCASWLPIILQNPAEIPPTWNMLRGEDRNWHICQLTQETTHLPQSKQVHQELDILISSLDWTHFLTHDSDNPNPQNGIYRIFEPDWKNVILFWLGSQTVSKTKKEAFINALISFKDNCGQHNFYGIQAYLFAAIVLKVKEFQSSRTDEVIGQLVKWYIGDFEHEQKRLLFSVNYLQESLKKTFCKIDNLILDKELKKLKITVTNPLLIEKIQQIPNSSETTDIIYFTPPSKIKDSQSSASAETVTTLLQQLSFLLESIKITESCLQCGLRINIQGTMYCTECGQAILSDLEQKIVNIIIKLGSLGLENHEVSKTLISLLSLNLNRTLLKEAIISLGKIASKDQKAIEMLTQLIQELPSPKNYKNQAPLKHLLKQAILSLGKIDICNRVAFENLIQFLSQKDFDTHCCSQLIEMLQANPIEFCPLALQWLTTVPQERLVKYHYEIICLCGQNMSYQNFYQAWKQKFP